MNPFVTAVSCSKAHTFSKPNESSICLLTGLGVEGDAHLGETVKHRSRHDGFRKKVLSWAKNILTLLQNTSATTKKRLSFGRSTTQQIIWTSFVRLR